MLRRGGWRDQQHRRARPTGINQGPDLPIPGRGSHHRWCRRVDHPPSSAPTSPAPPLDPKATEGRWEEIKAELSDRQLTDGLQRELAAVDEYLKIRNWAAHAITMVAHAGESTQIRGSTEDRD